MTGIKNEPEVFKLGSVLGGVSCQGAGYVEWGLKRCRYDGRSTWFQRKCPSFPKIIACVHAHTLVSYIVMEKLI